MSGRDIMLHQLIGRTVHDADGEAVGRIQELSAEIELHTHSNDYVVTEFHVGSYGLIESLAGSAFARRLASVLGLGGRDARTIRWEQMDLSDPERPRLTVRKSELE